MKTFKFLLLLIFVTSISCKEEKPKQKTNINSKVAVKHYICLNKCENSGSDAQGVCPTCNTPYTHNVAFHNDDLLKNGPLKVPINTPTSNQNNAITPPAPAAAQNAAGVYHYTCTNGCVGGAGSMVDCKSCGTPLEHNQAYHNN
ncbi:MULTISPECIES: hypothetical protein [Flavobacteriaceae]|uniref:Uncharacterized protein n=2 Tax=Flavobacteriaceae TaxID=49546 RepID=A0A4Y8AV56_9FLAO|nr:MULTISPECIES: hypothetical protein [Flavobacteriaceae]TEW76433.1 hypothetical protein E2488_00860 [Gramella jeungdoensis]GGK52794.1 hypothetical protein GCM10007963_21470 [Lutibacter litoralis]